MSCLLPATPQFARERLEGLQEKLSTLKLENMGLDQKVRLPCGSDTQGGGAVGGVGAATLQQVASS